MESLAELIPSVYSASDSDGSLAKFVSVYDETHAEQLDVVESLQTIRIPTMAPKQFITDIADALGSPFPFMTADRWQRGNKLNALAFIYSLRGSQAGIQSVILYLCGVIATVETDFQYSWILGVSPLAGTPIDKAHAIMLVDTVTSAYWTLTVDAGSLTLTPAFVIPGAAGVVHFNDTSNGLCYQVSVTNGALTLTQVPATESAFDSYSLIDLTSATNSVTSDVVCTNGTLTIVSND